MRKGLLVIAVLFITMAGFGQEKDTIAYSFDFSIEKNDRISMAENTITIQETYSEKGWEYYELVITAKTETDTGIKLDPSLTINLDKTYQKNIDDGFGIVHSKVCYDEISNDAIKKIIFKVKNDIAKEEDQVIIIEPTFSYVIDESPEQLVIIIKDSKKPFDAENPFRVALGSNFDFVNGVKPNSLYAQVSFNHPTLIYEPWTKTKKCGKKKGEIKAKRFILGLDAGLYQTKSITFDSSLSVTDLEFISEQSGNYQYFKSEYKKKASVTATNLALFINPSIQLTPRLSDNNEKSYISLGLYSEALHRNFNTSYSYILQNTDTIDSPDEINDSTILIQTASLKRNEFYLGGSVNLQYKSKWGEFRLLAAGGLEWNKTKGIDSTMRSYFYLFRFGVLEKTVGVEFGGEVRGLFGKEDHFVGVYLSKVFGLKKFLSYN